MEVRKGYKQTEIGAIPDDWDTKRLGEIFSITAGGDLRKDCFSLIQDEIYCYPIYSNALSNDGFYGYSSKYTNKENTITVTARGEVGKANPRITKYTAIGRVIVLKPNEDLDCYYVAACINQLVDFANESTGVPQLTAPQISKYSIPYPIKDEQTAIACSLSDIDALITSLEKLIAKKRNIKQGAMQGLLTGSKRLPGFSGKWDVKRFGEYGLFKGGSGFPIKYQGQIEGDIPFFKVSDMNNLGNEVFMTNSNNWVTGSKTKEIGAFVFPLNTVVFAKIGAAIFLERKKVLVKPSCIDNNMMGFIVDESKSDIRYIHYLFHTIKLGSLVSATALPSINGKQIAELVIQFPIKEEQIAIAQVLSDMDAEIESLGRKLEKYKLIKQGMMQELLTGKTRLV
jgi:type I restriction enzyme S subunit